MGAGGTSGKGEMLASMSMNAKQPRVGHLRIIIQCWYCVILTLLSHVNFTALMASTVQQNLVLQSALGSMHSIRNEETERRNDFP